MLNINYFIPDAYIFCSQSLPLPSVPFNGDWQKTSSKSEGAAIDSRKVSFIDKLTDPKFEQQLQQHLKIVKDARESGEFVKNSKPNSSAGATSSNEVVDQREGMNNNNPPPDTDEEKESKIRNLK